MFIILILPKTGRIHYTLTHSVITDASRYLIICIGRLEKKKTFNANFKITNKNKKADNNDRVSDKISSVYSYKLPKLEHKIKRNSTEIDYFHF